MGDFGKRIGRFLVGFLLFIFLFSFIFISAITHEATPDRIYGAGSEAIAKAYLEKIKENGGEGDSAQVYRDLTTDCANSRDGTVVLGESNITADCDKISAAGAQGVEDYLYGVLESNIRTGIEQSLRETGLGEYLIIGKWIVWTLGAFALLLVLVMFTLSIPRHIFFTNLGIVLILVGLPFLIISSIDLSFDNWPDEVNSLVALFLITLKLRLLICFIVGIILLIVGVTLGIKEKQNEEIKKTSKG